MCLLLSLPPSLIYHAILFQAKFFPHLPQKHSSFEHAHQDQNRTQSQPRHREYWRVRTVWNVRRGFHAEAPDGLLNFQYALSDRRIYSQENLQTLEWYGCPIISHDENMSETGCIDIAQPSHWAWIVRSRRTPFWTLRMRAGPWLPQPSVKYCCMLLFDHYITRKHMSEGWFTNAECDIGMIWQASCPRKLIFLLSFPVMAHTPSLSRTRSIKTDCCNSLAGLV